MASVSGGYMNQPPVGASPKKMLAKKASPPTQYAQNAYADSRGNGRSRAASMLGSSSTPIASTAGTANRNIITVPCIVKSWLYSDGPTSVLSGTASCVRITSASTPASTKNRNAVADVEHADVGVVDDGEQPQPARRAPGALAAAASSSGGRGSGLGSDSDARCVIAGLRGTRRWRRARRREACRTTASGCRA